MEGGEVRSGGQSARWFNSAFAQALLMTLVAPWDADRSCAAALASRTVARAPSHGPRQRHIMVSHLCISNTHGCPQGCMSERLAAKRKRKNELEEGGKLVRVSGLNSLGSSMAATEDKSAGHSGAKYLEATIDAGAAESDMGVEQAQPSEGSRRGQDECTRRQNPRDESGRAAPQGHQCERAHTHAKMQVMCVCVYDGGVDVHLGHV